jgi:hypothetical protein
VSWGFGLIQLRVYGSFVLLHTTAVQWTGPWCSNSPREDKVEVLRPESASEFNNLRKTIVKYYLEE